MTIRILAPLKIEVRPVLERLGIIILALVAGCMFSGSVFASNLVGQDPIAFAARVVGDENRSRLIVDFDRAVEEDVYLLDNPKRIIIDLPETFFSLEGELEKLPKSLVKDLRYGKVAQGQSRMVIELTKPVSISSHRVKEVKGEGRHRMFVDFVTTTDASFKESVRKPSKKVNEPKVSSVFKARESFTVVLDPGHGGVDGGATGARNVVEKRITLQFAQILKTELEKNPHFSVLLTRNADQFVRLEKRVKFARDSKADLFLSIHADSLAQKNIRGATVYTLSEDGSDDISRALARKQNRSDLIAGLELPATQPKVFDILIDMTRRETEQFSRQFADLLVKRMQDGVKLIRNPHRSADFYVLKAPEVPSVLLELGYLSNAQDALLMASKEWQERAVKQTVEAITEFFDVRLAQK
ncbi:MAG: N-acetylmuramoyl-L-alanine amidase [Rhizobiaceae bacterium]